MIADNPKGLTIKQIQMRVPYKNVSTYVSMLVRSGAVRVLDKTFEGAKTKPRNIYGPVKKSCG